MKKFYLLFAFLFCASASFSQTLFTYGNKSVDKQEFLRAYNKNKTPVTDKEKALREYLDLYIKFKLKVNAALELRLDTLPQLVYDAQSFRSQIEDSYLNNEKAMDELLTEAFNRSQKDLHVLHFFVPVDNTVKADDTLKAYKAISELYTALNSGNTDYEKLTEAARPVTVRKTDIGFITVFSLPYEYENIIYSQKTGQVSNPYRSKSGWHIFKVIDERKAVGKWKVSQILLAMPPETQAADKKLLEKKADSIYRLLQQGADFGLMARQFSDDKLTYGNNGELAEFGSGKYELDFEKEVFSLSRDGETGKPFLTNYGYHIVKRMSHSPVTADKNDQAFLFELKQKLQQDSRINIARVLFTKEVLKQVNLKRTGAVSDADLFRYADSIIANPSAEPGITSQYPISNKAVYSFTNAKLTGKDWLDFIRTYRANAELYQGESNTVLTEKFTSGAAVDYYKAHLEDYNPEFRYQMQEFKEGNVLFEIMERKIWNNAANDAAGLQKQYDENKNKYLWAASADIILFNCFNKQTADASREALHNHKDWKKIVEESNNTVQADSGRFEISQLPLTFDDTYTDGDITGITVNPMDSTVGFAKIIKRYPAGLQRSFEEARGLVINDYQNILEEKWITDLKKKYPVKVNETVFQSLLK